MRDRRASGKGQGPIVPGERECLERRQSSKGAWGMGVNGQGPLIYHYD